MPVGGLLISVFVGWSLDKKAILGELSNAGTLKVSYFKFYIFLVRYFAPVAISLIIINQLGLGKMLGLE